MAMPDYDYTQDQIDISYMKLYDLPSDLLLYTNLKKLYCHFNYLTHFDSNTLPPSLEILYCVGNTLTHLDNLPNGLIELNCSNNYLTHLDNLPPNLVELVCQFNKITKLNNLPQSLKELYYVGNPLEYDFKPTLENIRSYIASY